MTTPAPSTSSSSSPSARIARTTAIVGATAAALGATATAALDRHGAAAFPKCTDVQNVTHVRGLKLHAAAIAGDSVFLVPIRVDSLGAPALDLADRSPVTDSALAVICRVSPGDSTATPTAP